MAAPAALSNVCVTSHTMSVVDTLPRREGVTGAIMIILPLDAEHDVPSQLTRALRGRRVAIAARDGQEAKPHLYTALATTWRASVEGANETIVALREIEASGPEVNFAPEALMRALKALIYAATETFDFYIGVLPGQLEHGRSKAERRLIQEYRAGVKRVRDPTARMCNLMKHNFRELVAARFVSLADGAMTFVYRLNVAQDGLQRADTAVHGEIGFTSVEKTLHEIIHGLLRVDSNAAVLVDKLSDNHDQLIELAGPTRLRLAGLLAQLCHRTPRVASTESSKFDGVRFDGESLVLTRVTADKLAEPTERTMHITVDEAALSAELMV